MTDEWLSLSDVAEFLGVHPSTVRVWSDKGMLPVHRTQGGHRRYLHSELDLWRQSQRTNGASEAHLVVQNALRTMRFQISEGRLAEEAWYTKLDEEARAQYRKSGRTLLESLFSFVASHGTEAAAEGRSVGYEYASRGRRYGMSVAEAVHAFLFFRNLLMDAMLTVYEAAAVQSPSAWSDMFRKVNEFTDQILATLLETYEAYERGNQRA